MKNSLKQGYTYVAYRDQVCLILAKRRQARKAGIDVREGKLT